jgi:hypothetical protein
MIALMYRGDFVLTFKTFAECKDMMPWLRRLLLRSGEAAETLRFIECLPLT